MNAFEAELMDNFDFDEWAMLARTAPDEFEQRRRALIESEILLSDNVHRLRGLQWRIDLEISRARNPMDACVRLSNMMWDSFMDLNQALNDCVGNDCASTRAASHSAQSAKIIHLATKYIPHE
jgi:hypothetical protein